MLLIVIKLFIIGSTPQILFCLFRGNILHFTSSSSTSFFAIRNVARKSCQSDKIVYTFSMEEKRTNQNKVQIICVHFIKVFVNKKNKIIDWLIEMHAMKVKVNDFWNIVFCIYINFLPGKSIHLFSYKLRMINMRISCTRLINHVFFGLLG